MTMIVFQTLQMLLLVAMGYMIGRSSGMEAAHSAASARLAQLESVTNQMIGDYAECRAVLGARR
mgnify:CR=1 FL=1